MKSYMVFTTMNNGELRAYSVTRDIAENIKGNDYLKIIEELIEEAKTMDNNTYPDNPSPFINVSVIEGHSVYDIVWGDVL
jgi:hypothetical protein